MHLLYVTASLPHGPGEAFLLPEIAELRRRGHRVTLVPTFPRGPVVHAEVAPFLADAEIEPLASWTVLAGAAREALRSPRAALRAITWALRSRSATLVVKNLAAAARGLWLAEVARRRRVDHVHAYWAAAAATTAMVAGDAAGVPWSFTAHRWDVAENSLLALKLRRAVLARFVSRKSLAMLDVVGVRGPRDRARVLHLGVPLPAASFPQVAWSAPGRPLVVLCAANFQVLKGHTFLVQGVAEARARGADVVLWLAGDGACRAELEAEVVELGIGAHVRFLGQLPQEELLALYAGGAVDVVALASTEVGLQHEGIPVSLLEGMSHGLPVVATASGGIPELLADGAGILVPQCDPGAFADAFVALAEAPEERVRWGLAGRRRVEAQFEVRREVTRFLRRLAEAEADAAGRPRARRRRRGPVIPKQIERSNV